MKRFLIILLLTLGSIAQGANEINAFAPGVTTAYSVVREIDGDVWYVSGQVFEAWGTDARTAADYDIALTDKSGNMFVGTMDTNIGAGDYHIITHYQAAGAPADTDPAVYEEYGYWSGSVWSSDSDKIGTPVALDGGLATIAGMLTKMVDDNDGADYNAARESLKDLRDRGDLAWATGVGATPTAVYTIDSIVRTVGDDDGGTDADVDVVDGSYFSTGEIATTTKLEVDAAFTATAADESPVSLLIWGYYTGAGGHHQEVEAYNYIDSGYEKLGELPNASGVELYTFTLNPQHINTSSGAMAVKLVHSSHNGITSHALHIDKILVSTTMLSSIPGDVWEELVADHTDEPTFGGEVGGLDPNITLILADTDELQQDWTDGGRLDLLIDAIKYKTDLITILDTVVKDSNDPNNFTMEDGVDVNDALWFSVIMVEDADDSHSEVRYIDRYDENSTDPNVWVDEPFSFTPAVGDVVHVMGTDYGGYLYLMWSYLKETRAPTNYIDTTTTGGSPAGAGTLRFDALGEDP